MDVSQISIGLAFLAGLASFLSPCVFSLVPAYVGYLGGLARPADRTANPTAGSHSVMGLPSCLDLA